MNVREKLVELLADHCDMKDKRCIGCEKGLQEAIECKKDRFGKTADHLIAHGITVQEWIPASEPPKDHKEYIVMIKDAKCPTTLWYRPKQKTWNEACGDKNYDVTYWQNLPQSPKGE